MTIATINPPQLAELCKSGKIDLIDVRTPVEFREVHVKLARNFPLDRLDPAALAKSHAGDKDGPLYIICRSGSRGRQACEKFVAAGYTNVVNIEGGTLACVEAGLADLPWPEVNLAGTASPHCGRVAYRAGGNARLARAPRTLRPVCLYRGRSGIRWRH